MELWTVGNKTILLLFVVIATYFTAAQPDPWIVLLFLIYSALNLVLHIVKGSRLKQGAIVLIELFLIGCAMYHPFFTLLLPFGCYELATFYPRKNGVVLLVILIPLIFLRDSMMVLYMFVAALSYFNYVLVRPSPGRRKRADT
ncbi:hypothetical protein [Paenibacillus sp. AR247]|uniref:hypothetical protein n=1 Tax=Paenibacillus sp. AR247 TaxID=1631599 RepID=UPI000CF993BD|nr:hypothetical protein [Paenibacillus sp. AR247]PQP86281.1 hypothetical protein CPT76_31910 [Paenibacillus sp. AR247]